MKPYNNIGDYLPEPKEISKLPKQWIANVCATILKGTFSNWVREKVNERNEKLLVKSGLTIQMDPEIAEAFKASTKLSSK